MAETLGSLCDKLTIVKLKEFHSADEARLVSLRKQAADLGSEIDGFVRDAMSGLIPPEKLTFAANKVYKREGNEFRPVEGKIAEVFAELARINCVLWHEQEKVYEFETIPVAEKDRVVKQLALLNLQRNQCIDAIDKSFQQQILSRSVP